MAPATRRRRESTAAEAVGERPSAPAPVRQPGASLPRYLAAQAVPGEPERETTVSRRRTDGRAIAAATEEAQPLVEPTPRGDVAAEVGGRTSGGSPDGAAPVGEAPEHEVARAEGETAQEGAEEKPAEGEMDEDIEGGEEEEEEGEGEEEEGEEETEEEAEGAEEAEEEAGEAEAGEGERAEEEGEAQVAAAAEEDPDPLPPIPPPAELGGIIARVIPLPPVMSRERRLDILARTGMRPEAHHAVIRQRLDGIAERARRLQDDIVREARLAGFDALAAFNSKADEIPGMTAAAEEQVRGAYAGARARVHEKAEEALDQLREANRRSGARLDTSSLTMQQQLQRVLASGSPAIMQLHQEQLAEVDRSLNEYAGKFRTELGKKEKAIRESEARSVSSSAPDSEESRVVQLPWEIPRAELMPVRLEAEERAWPMRAGQKADDIHRSIEQNARQVLAQHDTFSLVILQLVNPAAVQLKEVTEHEQGQVGGARVQTVDRVATDYERAVNAVNGFRDRAMKQLDAGEKGAVKEIRAIGRRLETSIRKRGSNLDLAIAETARDLAEAYRVQMAGVNESIDADRFLDARQTEPQLAVAEKRFDEMYEQQSASLAETVGEASAAADATIALQIRGANEIADNSASEAWKIARDQTDAIDNAARLFGDALNAPTESVTGVASPYTATASETLGHRPEQVRTAVAAMIAGTRRTLQETFDAEQRRLQGEVENLPASLRSSLIADGLAKISDLNDRVRRAYKAMVGLGTDERQLLGALRNLTEIQGKAMELIWKNRIPPSKLPMANVEVLGSLRDWLDDELSGDEYDAAIAYLEGRTAEGARFELEASMRWYGDDEERIEEVLRDLQQEPPKGGHIGALKNTEGWSETNERLQSNLGGTDLDVANALLAGNRYRADALRLRERIEAARRRGQHDKVHELLEAVPAHELAEVRREFVAVERGLGPERNASAGVTDREARDTFVRFVTEDREVYDPHASQYGGPRTRTMSITGANRTLAVALASRSWDAERQEEAFESQVAVRAARMEVEVGRRGDKKLDNLQRGFEYDQDAEINDQLNSPDEIVRLAAEARRTRARQVRMAAMREFAERHGGLRGATDADAIRYASGVVGNLFSSEEGRQFGTSMVQQGFADPAAAMRLAVEGRGTDEDLIKRTLSRLDRDQIKQLRQDYRDRYKEDLDQRLGTNQPKRDERVALAAMAVSPLLGAAMLAAPGGELSGDERLEVELLLRGRPRNDRERYELEMARTEQQRTETGFAGRAMMQGSLDEHLMNESNRRMIDIVDRAGGVEKAFDKNGRFIGASPRRGAGGLEPDPEEAWAFGEELKWNQFGAEAYQAGIDRMANFLATALAVIAAVVVAIVIPGAGGAIAGAIIGGLLSMATKAALKGGRYGWEEAAVDLAVTAVDAVTAGLTRGMGQALRGAGAAAKGAGGAAARRSTAVFAGLAARGRAGRAVAYVASEGIENFVGSVPSALTANLLNDQNWKGGSPFENILKGTLIEAGISTGIGLGVGATMDVGSTAFGAIRGSLRERALRTQLAASVPSEMRQGLADVPILELPGKQFDQLTGSRSGQAVTIFTPDGPVIYMREGANPRVLREEGIHLMQAKEVEWQSRIADLSETNLARWPEMSLGEQLALYRTKIDVEIDAQQRLLADLGDELALAGPLSAIPLRSRIREAEITLDNLQRRRIEVERYTPERIQRIADQAETRPKFLDEPPRLFAKKSPRRGRTPAKTQDVEVKGLDENTRVRKLPTAETSPNRSPLSGRDDVTGTVVQIGKSWKEPNGREYRLVGVVDDAGNLTHVRQEIRSKHEGNRWVQRGSESQKRGEVAEEASRLKSAADADPDWPTTKAVDSQWDPSGRGFDEVLLDFRMENGEIVARVRVVEVKDYPGRYVPLESFTAVRPQSKGGSLQKNVEFIKRRLRKDGTKPPPDGLGLTEEQVRAALRAFRDGHVELEIRHTPGTLIGERDAGTVVKGLEQEWKDAGLGKRREPGKQQEVDGQPRVVEIDKEHMVAAQGGKDPRAAAELEPGASQAALREEMLRGATPRMRRELADVRIVELSPKDFRKLTDSSSAQAVTFFTDKGPVIYFKQGANPRALREERIHAMQWSDPRFKDRIHRLSEENLKNWDELDVGEQLALYRLKLELEIDAHEQLLLQLPQEIKATRGHAKRRAQAQLAETQVALDRLRAQMKKVDAIGPARIERMDANPDLRPDYLEQKPHLFSKEADGGTPSPARAAEREAPQRPGVELDRLIARQQRLEKEIAESHQREQVAEAAKLETRAKNVAAGRAARVRELEKVSAEIDAEVERLLPELSKMLNMEIPDLIAAIRRSIEARKAGRRLDAIDVLDSLRNRHREGRPPHFGNLEGAISEEAIEINAVALEELRAIIGAIEPDAVLAVQRGGSFLAEALEFGQAGFPPVHAVEKHEVIGPDGKVASYRVPNLEAKILQLIAPPFDQSTFVIVDFMMGRGFEGELRKMIERITAQHPHVTIRPLWMRETHGYERLTSRITLDDLKEGVAFVGTIRVRARTAEFAGVEYTGSQIKFRRESEGVLPPVEGDVLGTPLIERSQVPVTVVLGDDMAAVFDPESRKLIRIFDRNGRIVQEIQVPTTDPVTGERLETVRDVMIRIVQGHFTRKIVTP